MSLLKLLAATAVIPASAATLTTATAVPARSAACVVADIQLDTPGYAYASNGYSADDPLAVSPSLSGYRISTDAGCLDIDATVTVARPDGSQAHEVALDFICDDSDCPFIQVGFDRLPYATATGQWRATKITNRGEIVVLNHPVSFTLKRASTVTFSASVNVPSQPRASGVVKYWTAAGTQAPSPGRRVNIWGWLDGNQRTIASTTTDRNGRFAVAVRWVPNAVVQAAVPSTGTVGWVTSDQMYARLLHPTTITGTAAPTSATAIRNGTKMSTYGHLRVLNNAGQSIPAAGKTVVVQTRPKSNPAAGYSTVGTATTTSTGYYYTNWTASVDADVRVAFISPYQTITSSYRYVRAIDVR